MSGLDSTRQDITIEEDDEAVMAQLALRGIGAITKSLENGRTSITVIDGINTRDRVISVLGKLGFTVVEDESLLDV